MNLIVAVTKDYAIGKDNKLLFHLPSDLAYFKQKTTGKVVIMGERTYLSLPRRPLPNRTNIVLSDKTDFEALGAIVVHSVDELFAELKKYNSNDIFVCGGASVYNMLMDYCDVAYITMVDEIVSADTYINNIEERGFKLKEESLAQQENGHTFKFRTYVNKNAKKFD